MAQYIYTMNRVGKTVPPGRHILKNISLSFFPGAKIGVLGLNGSGKSTLLKIMAGLDKDIEGEAIPQSGIKVGYLPQEPELDESADVLTNIELGIQETKQLLIDFDELNAKFAEPMSDEEMNALLEQQANLQNAIDAANAWELDRTLEIAAEALRLPPWKTKVQVLSGGEKRRVALCQLLLSNPDMLLLDEPTNHLDAESVAWLEQFLCQFSGTVVAITHDRYFLDNAAEWILELDRGEGIPYQGNYSSWLEQKEQRLAQEQRQQATHQKTIKAELEWVRSNAKGRHSKSKSRLARFDELNSKEFQSRNETQEIYIPPGPRLGDQVIDIQNLQKSFEGKLLYQDMSFSIPPGAIVGVVGANGAGKSTLFNIISQQDVADSGVVTIGETVKLAYVDQSRDSLNGDNTVWEEVSEGLDNIIIGTYEISSRAYLGRFNFKGSDQQKLVKSLSGGERNRLHLAKLLKQGANVLLLDEPTNDLDIETLRALEEALLSFPGSAIVISHDRWFLDRIATHILAFQGDSQTDFFEGSYSEYENWCKKHNKTSGPKRIKYKKIN